MIRFLAGVLAAAIIFFAIQYFIPDSMDGPETTSENTPEIMSQDTPAKSLTFKEKQALLKKSYDEALEMVSLPMEIDPFTTWTKIDIDMDELFIIYHYQVKESLKPDFLIKKKDEFKKNIVTIICGNPASRHILENGVHMRWHYNDAKNNHIMDLEYTDNCS